MANRKSGSKSDEITMEKVRELFENMFKQQEVNILKILAANTQLFTGQMKAMDNKIDDLKNSLQFSQNETKNEIKILKEQHRSEINELKDKIREIEDRSRRNNIRVEGLKESVNEDWLTTKDKLHDMFKKQLGIKEKITIERAHRGGGQRQGGKPRAIIAKILNFEDKELILTNARKLKGTGVFIHEDFSRETVVIRQKLWEEVKQLREKGKYAVLKYDRIFTRDFRK